MKPSLDPADYILQAPVFHPMLPYITTIFGGLAPGKMVTVQGTVPVEADRFQVDFQTGSSMTPRADIAIHFNPRFRSQPHVICNTLNEGHWMEETKFPKLPLKGGDSFLLLFFFEKDHVKVSVNGHDYLQYGFNLPLARVNTLGVSGDVFVKTIAFLANNPFDASRTEYPVAPHLFLNNTQLTVPLSRPLPNSLRPGETITVRGMVRQDPKEFRVSFKKDPSHVSLCFCVSFMSQTALWCSPLDQANESVEEPVPFFPFHPLRYFELLFLCTEEHLKLALNGAPLSWSSLPPLATNPITELAIDGDVLLYGILC